MTNVFLRIEHDTAEPEALTAALGVTPTYSAKRGQLPAGGKGEPYPWNVWVLSSAYAVVSKDTRAHFQWLLASVGSGEAKATDASAAPATSPKRTSRAAPAA